jgi:hypothetical protein
VSTIPETPHQQTMRPSAAREWSPWATGLALFAGALMVTVGIFQMLQGLVALFDDSFFVVTENYTFEFDVTAWGWIHLIGGALVALVGCFVVRGSLWARIVAMILVGLTGVANFLWIPYYPVWSVLIVALCVLVVWALAVYDPKQVD